MPTSNMAIVTNLILLAGTFAAAVLGIAPYSNGVFTETAAVQELGSITSAGTLVYSLNVCTIVHSTNCEVTMSSGGAAPAKPATPTAVASSGNAVDEPKQPVQTTTDPGGVSTAVTQAASSVLASGQSSNAAPTLTQSVESQPSGSGTDTPSATSTGAGNAVGAVKGVAFGAAAVAVANFF
ncbi:hypothetical protein RJ55_08577 [Drechmeria coniospora]|nr:hypothetical protein RJ55_08577 [Drechmeria coniospora]